MSDNGQEKQVLFEIKQLCKSFGPTKVLDHIDATIRQGEVVVIVGPSGSGKSTFLRSLNLLEMPTSGEILFEGKEIRSIWDGEKGDYYFSVVDVIGALTDSSNPRKYWSVLKTRLKKEGSEVTTNCSQLKMLAPDGKIRLRDAMVTKDIFRFIESIPSPKAEPMKMWLANLGSERIDEVFDPEIAINRAVNYYRNKGYSDKWVESRLKGILNRNKLTDIW